MQTRENHRSRMPAFWNRSEEMVQQHPFSSSMLAFGVGTAVGMLLIAAAEPARRSERDLHGFAHRLGSQILDAVRSSLPEAAAEYFR